MPRVNKNIIVEGLMRAITRYNTLLTLRSS